MAEGKNDIPPKPSDPAAEGYTWIYDGNEKQWREVPMEIRMPGEEPFFPRDTSPLNLPKDANPLKPPNLNKAELVKQE